MFTKITPHTDRYGRRGFLLNVQYDGRTGYAFSLTMPEANRLWENARERFFNGLSPMGGLVDTIEEACGESMAA